MKSFFQWLFNPPTNGPVATFCLRMMCGGVFFWEGIMKFVFANQGVGRFTKLGMPFPAFTADSIACFGNCRRLDADCWFGHAFDCHSLS